VKKIILDGVIKDFILSPPLSDSAVQGFLSYSYKLAEFLFDYQALGQVVVQQKSAFYLDHLLLLPQ
jgi:hypothetical protein